MIILGCFGGVPPFKETPMLSNVIYLTFVENCGDLWSLVRLAKVRFGGFCGKRGKDLSRVLSLSLQLL